LLLGQCSVYKPTTLVSHKGCQNSAQNLGKTKSIS